jgi:fatty-acyl-CoA synthase
MLYVNKNMDNPQEDSAPITRGRGRSLAGCDIKSIASGGRECHIGELGELIVKSDFNMSGYYNRPEATAAAFTTDGYLHTGDICRKRSDVNFEFVGRIKEMFKSGGDDIYPLEIEDAIGEHPNVSVSAVLNIPDPKFQEVGYAFVVPRPGVSNSEEDLKKFLGPRIANLKLPRSLMFERL